MSKNNKYFLFLKKNNITNFQIKYYKKFLKEYFNFIKKEDLKKFNYFTNNVDESKI